MDTRQPIGTVTFDEALCAERTFEVWQRLTSRQGMVPLLCICRCAVGAEVKLPMLPHAGTMSREHVRIVLLAALEQLDSAGLGAYGEDGRPA